MVSYQQQDTTTLQNIPDPSGTATMQNVSEFFDITINIPKSPTKTNYSNILQIPVHDITQNTINDQNQTDTTHDTKQDNIFTLSTSNTHITQQFQTSLPTYDPPLFLLYATQITQHNSP